MDVSVIILNYNTFEVTCNCIRSVLAETTGCTYEIIVVDNNSSEKDPRIFLKLFPDVVLVENAVNLGFAKGNNSGLEKASGEVILLLNSDTELKNDAISICFRSLKENADVAVVGARLEYPDGTVQHNCQRFPALRYKLFELFRMQKMLPSTWGGKFLLGYFFDHQAKVFPDWIWGTFFMFRRALLSELPLGKLADDFFMYVEDMQWCMDFSKRGYKIAFEPSARVMHAMGKSTGDKESLMERNKQIFFDRNYSRLRQMMFRQLDKWLIQ
jgi:GT2 family glycosyltransferase